MKFLILAFTLLVSLHTKAQQLIRVKDSLNGFSVAIPHDWYNPDDNIQEDLKFMAWRQPEDTTSTRLPTNVMIFVQPFDEEEPGLATLVQLLDSSNEMAGYSDLIDSGTIETFNQKIQWINKRYVTTDSPDTLFSSNFITYANGKVYVMTMSCIDDERAENTDLFMLMGRSLFVGDAIREEFLKVNLPTDTRWTTLSDVLMAEGRILQMLPAEETLETWTSVYAGITSRFLQIRTIDEALQYYTDNWKTSIPNLQILSVDKGTISEGQWALVRVDTTPDNTPDMKESSVYYFLITDHYLHLHSITKRGNPLTPEAARAWGDLFKSGKIVYE